jgi:hypothetical protein
MVAFLAHEEAVRLRHDFHNRLCIMSDILIYWDGKARKILTRSAAAHHPAPPPDTVYVGRYAAPSSPDWFLDDLDYLLGEIARQRPV